MVYQQHSWSSVCQLGRRHLSRLSSIWTLLASDNFHLSTLLVHQFELAEREGDIYLKQLTMERMMKQFFLAGHIWYARYLTQYLLEMRVLHAEARRTLSVGITMDNGMLSLPTRLVSKLPSRWAKELSKA